MDVVEWMKKSVRSNLPLATIVEKVSWEKLSPGDRKELIGDVRVLWNDNPAAAYELLQVLFRISKDNWYKLEVLYYALQHPECKGDARQKTLRTTQNMLQQLEPTNPSQVLLHQRCRAIFHYYTGRMLLDVNDLEGALENWRRTHAIFLETGLKPQAERIQAEIDEIQPRVEPQPTRNDDRVESEPGAADEADQSLLARQEQVALLQQVALLNEEKAELQATIIARKTEIQAQIEAADRQLITVRAAVKETETRLVQTQGELQQLKNENNALSNERDKLKASIAAANGELEQIRQKINAQRAELLAEAQRAAAEQTIPPGDGQEISALRSQLLILQHKNSELEQKLEKRDEKVLPDWARPLDSKNRR